MKLHLHKNLNEIEFNEKFQKINLHLGGIKKVLLEDFHVPIESYGNECDKIIDRVTNEFKYFVNKNERNALSKLENEILQETEALIRHNRLPDPFHACVFPPNTNN
jgi:hypothetical protein